MSVFRPCLHDAIVALVLLGAACSSKPGEERPSIEGLAEPAREPASGVAIRITAVGRSIPKTEAEVAAGQPEQAKQPGKSAVPGGKETDRIEAEDREEAAEVAEKEAEAELAAGPAKEPAARKPARAESGALPVEKGREVSDPAELPRQGGGSGLECLTYRAVARPLGFAYDHLVYLDNRCEQRLRCTVTTNVNPSPVVKEIEPGETEVALTFRGSPARQFEVRVDCGQSETGLR